MLAMRPPRDFPPITSLAPPPRVSTALFQASRRTGSRSGAPPRRPVSLRARMYGNSKRATRTPPEASCRATSFRNGAFIGAPAPWARTTVVGASSGPSKRKSELERVTGIEPHSPDPAGLRSHHRLGFLALERFRKLGKVRHDSVVAVLVGRVRVGDGVRPEVLGPLVLAGPLGEPDEEALVGTEPVPLLQVGPRNGVLPGDVGE